ncbi:MAG: nascent polypeptide-associated complex protein [Candidatus Aenigmarchaeota archaeon]|nr:nascent polypeptide-associated complex protein [Candidatus Aenigmarchaeota archaeon]
MFNISTRQMEKMMAQLGIKSENIDAKRVIIERDEGNIIIENPQITKMVIQGNETFQIVGESKIEKIKFSEDDIKLVMEQTGASREVVEKTLNETNDIAEAILKLKK